MEIHVVAPGETIESIAALYGLSPERIIQDNELGNPNNLVVGQTIVILYPIATYTVKEGDTLDSIAETTGVSKLQILRNNPSLSDGDFLYPGETIILEYDTEKIRNVFINGYAYPFIDRTVLRKTLPYLTTLTLFTYGFTTEGELIPIDDVELINIAREYGVAPIMLLSTLSEEGVFSTELAHHILNNEESQNRLIDNIIANMEAKNYVGFDADFEYLSAEDKEPYVEFLRKITERVHAIGGFVMTALAPKTSPDQPGLLYEGHDYEAIGSIVDKILLMTYEWGYAFGPPMAVSPLNKVREVLDYAATVIPSEKTLMGFPNYAYDWKLPFIRGESKAQSMGIVEATEQAAEVGTTILFDEVARTPYYYYTDDITGTPVEHVVWFEDARSARDKMSLVDEYNLNGIGVWNIMKYWPQMWLVINALYDINKIPL
jgi:spore germination protein